VRRPWRAAGFLRSFFTGSEETYLDQMVRTKRKKTAPVARPQHDRRRDVPTSAVDDRAVASASS
jgi:hypothetical protein